MRRWISPNENENEKNEKNEEPEDPIQCLFHSCLVGDLTTTQWLVSERGVNPLVSLSSDSEMLPSWFYQEGDTPLSVAQKYGHTKVVHYLSLLSKGLSPPKKSPRKKKRQDAIEEDFQISMGEIKSFQVSRTISAPKGHQMGYQPGQSGHQMGYQTGHLGHQMGQQRQRKQSLGQQQMQGRQYVGGQRKQQLQQLQQRSMRERILFPVAQQEQIVGQQRQLQQQLQQQLQHQGIELGQLQTEQIQQVRQQARKEHQQKIFLPEKPLRKRHLVASSSSPNLVGIEKEREKEREKESEKECEKECEKEGEEKEKERIDVRVRKPSNYQRTYFPSSRNCSFRPRPSSSSSSNPPLSPSSLSHSPSPPHSPFSSPPLSLPSPSPSPPSPSPPSPSPPSPSPPSPSPPSPPPSSKNPNSPNSKKRKAVPPRLSPCPARSSLSSLSFLPRSSFSFSPSPSRSPSHLGSVSSPSPSPSSPPSVSANPNSIEISRNTFLLRSNDSSDSLERKKKKRERKKGSRREEKKDKRSVTPRKLVYKLSPSLSRRKDGEFSDSMVLQDLSPKLFKETLKKEFPKQNLTWILDQLSYDSLFWEEHLKFFYLTFICFCNWEDVVEGLLARLSSSSSSSFSPSCILLNFQYWVTQYPEDWSSKERKEKFTQLLSSQSFDIESHVRHALCELVENCSSSVVKMLVQQNQNQAKFPVSSQVNLSPPKTPMGVILGNSDKDKDIMEFQFDWHEMDEVVLAQNIALLDWRLFKLVKPRELFIYNNSKNKGKDSPALSTMINQFNTLCFWIVSEIVVRVRIEERKLLIQKVVDVTHFLVHLRDYFGAKALYTALCHPAVSRMEKTFLELTKETKKRITKLHRLLFMDSSNGAEYRSVLKIAPAPFVAYIGLHSRDVTFIYDASPSKYGDDVNLAKFNSISEIVFEVERGKDVGYDFQENFLVMAFLKDLPSLKNDLLFVWSKRVEPQDQEKLVEMFLENELLLSKELENKELENKLLREKLKYLEQKVKLATLSSSFSPSSPPLSSSSLPVSPPSSPSLSPLSSPLSLDSKKRAFSLSKNNVNLREKVLYDYHFDDEREEEEEEEEEEEKEEEEKEEEEEEKEEGEEEKEYFFSF